MKLAFIYSFEQSSWKSCQTITKNLMATYKSVSPGSQQKSFDLNDHTTSYEMLSTAKEITTFLPEKIIIVDHKPHPHKLLDAIHKCYLEKKIKKLPEIIIHIFGDFTLYSADWKKIEKALKSYSVKLVCASDSQKDLVRKFLKNKKVALYKCPFPVDSSDFYFDQNLRSKHRKALGLTDNQILFIYTGRLSLQKKVFDLMIDFSSYLKISNADAYLFFAGEFDDLGNPFKGIYGKEGMFFQNYVKMVENFDENTRKRIRYVGNLTTEELRGFYSAGDVFTSLSVHNDEDYGMSPAEAACTGLPLILSAWAGYRSFKLPNNECTLIDTSIDVYKLNYDKSQLLKALIITQKNIGAIRLKRIDLQRINNKVLSINDNKPVLKKIIEERVPKFAGFTPLLTELSKAFNKHPPFIDSKVEYFYSDLYKKIYDSYVSK
ncbi:MAG: glycosyltransferase [Bdellovibrionales bacterium]|nr:glycosyltransferase [Bdellovibrionales bacterium]